MELLQDVAASALILAIQLGVPVTVLFIYGFRTYQASPRRQNHLEQTGAGVMDGLESCAGSEPERRCWDVNECPPEVRQGCPAYAHPQLPCWQAVKLSLGRLQGRCLNCKRFVAPPANGGRRPRKGGDGHVPVASTGRRARSEGATEESRERRL